MIGFDCLHCGSRSLFSYSLTDAYHNTYLKIIFIKLRTSLDLCGKMLMISLLGPHLIRLVVLRRKRTKKKLGN